jgi:hypothetical protein
LSLTLSSAISFSRLVRKVAFAGESGRKRRTAMDTMKAIPPRTK